MGYKAKIERILREQGITPAHLAERLGITSRRLNDFTREGGVEPTGAVARLLDLMAGETNLGGQFQKTRLLLVVVHRDFVLPSNPPEVVEAVARHAEMHLSASETADIKIIRETNYVTISPPPETAWALMDSLKSKNIIPHLITGENITNEMLDCYFSSVTTWQAASHRENGLSDVIFAADMKKLWPLARHIKEMTGANVIAVFKSDKEIDDKLSSILDECGIAKLFLTGNRRIGEIAEKHVGYGYIKTDDGGRLFFHWNSMHKNSNGEDEMAFEMIPEHSRVSFAIDKNYKGPCAIDVQLIKLPDGESLEPKNKKRVVNKLSKDALCAAVTDAIESCAGDDGWAVMADVGNRLSIKLEAGLPVILEQLGYPPASKLKDFITSYPNKFMTRDDGLEATGKYRWVGLV